MYFDEINDTKYKEVNVKRPTSVKVGLYCIINIQFILHFFIPIDDY